MLSRSHTRRGTCHAPAARSAWPTISPAWTSSSSTNSAICLSPSPVGNCSSTWSAGSTSRLRHRHHEPRLRRVAVRLRRRQDDHRTPRPADPALRHRRNRQRELALQEQALSSLRPNDPEPAQLRNPDPLCRATSSPRDILRGSTLDADRGQLCEPFDSMALSRRGGGAPSGK